MTDRTAPARRDPVGAHATRKHDMVREQLRQVGAELSTEGLAALAVAARHDAAVDDGVAPVVVHALEREVELQLKRTYARLQRSGDPGRIMGHRPVRRLLDLPKAAR